MRDISKYQGIIPAFYACYDSRGEVDGERVEELTRYMVEKGVKGLYVGGSSGECIYQTVEDRKLTLEHVMRVAGNKLTVIAHVACNNTAQSRELARSRRSISTFPNMPLRNTGMIFPTRRRIPILSYIISPSWREWR